MKLRARHLLYALVAGPPIVLLVAWLGVIPVGAGSGHWAVTDWFLHFVMRSSVRTWSLGEPVPESEPLPREALRPAAGHYARGCALCHGAPGEPRAPAVLAMLPAPPELAPRVDEWTDAELHRIVMHGVRFTGMPAWPAPAREDEGWLMVAFLRALPELDERDYRPLVTAPEGVLPAACSGCHGPNGRKSGHYVPVIAGQSEAYMRASLEAYAEGRRASGIMQQAVSGLSPEAAAELASGLAALPAAPVTASAPPPDIAVRGRPEHGVPGCLACHGKDRRNPAFPWLDGQPAPYLAAQLRLFRDAARGGGPYANVMASVAGGLSDEDIEALSAWFAAR